MMWRLPLMTFIATLGHRLWPYFKPWLDRNRAFGVVSFLLVFALAIFFLLAVGCASTPRSFSVFGLDFSEKPLSSIMRVECNGKRDVVQGLYFCEEREPRRGSIDIKVMPIKGKVVFSDGLTQKAVDFGWRKSKGYWLWKKQVLRESWVPIDLGELGEIYGSKPIAFSVIGYSDKGALVNRGVLMHRTCNDRDVPCSSLIVNFDCVRRTKNTYKLQPGFCQRMSGSSQAFELPFKALDYKVKAGATLLIRAGRSGWTHEHKFSRSDLESPSYKVVYPKVLNGPELFSFALIQSEQGVMTSYHTHILIAGSHPKATPIDKPHWFKHKDGKKKDNVWGLPDWSAGSGQLEFCKAVDSELLEVVGLRSEHSYDECIEAKRPFNRTCAYSYDRESASVTYKCLDKNYKEVGL